MKDNYNNPGKGRLGAHVGHSGPLIAATGPES